MSYLLDVTGRSLGIKLLDDLRHAAYRRAEPRHGRVWDVDTEEKENTSSSSRSPATERGRGLDPETHCVTDFNDGSWGSVRERSSGWVWLDRHLIARSPSKKPSSNDPTKPWRKPSMPLSLRSSPPS
ncbi:hypothetical protein E4U51_004171 [Claviceps purpurea]|nr:hypothetical protein E4U51_004171 [Claviceps purpurea]